MWDIFNWWCVYFVWPLAYPIKKLPVPTKGGKISLITHMVKSCNPLLCLQPVCICSYLKSPVRYKFLIYFCISSGQFVFIWARMWGPWLFFTDKRGPRAKSLGNPASRQRTLSPNCKHKVYIYRNCKIYWHTKVCSLNIGSDSHLQELLLEHWMVCVNSRF